MGKDITHKGVIQEIDGVNIRVDIINKSLCSECHAKSMCMISDQKTKAIDVIYRGLESFSVGEEVVVSLRREQGMRAVLLSYVIPLCIFIILLLSLTGLLQNDLYTGLLSFLGVSIYYGMIYLFEDKTEQKIVFTIEKIN